MPEMDRCDKNPSLPKAYCAHCQDLIQRAMLHTPFSIKEGHSNGFPIVEILKEGGPIHFRDSEFQFGKRKVQMFLACIPVLREFWHSTDEKRRLFKSCLINNQELGLQVKVEMRPDFVNSSGQLVDRPFLFLETVTPDDTHIGIGGSKCQAICEVEQDLRKWLLKISATIRPVSSILL
jgi:hypothetical protein